MRTSAMVESSFKKGPMNRGVTRTDKRRGGRASARPGPPPRLRGSILPSSGPGRHQVRGRRLDQGLELLEGRPDDDRLGDLADEGLLGLQAVAGDAEDGRAVAVDLALLD